MFEHSSVFALLKDDNVYKIELHKDVQKEICQTFCNSACELLGREKVKFDGSYKPEDDESLFISEFKIADELKDAIRNPIGIQSFNPKEYDVALDVKAVFVGECEESEEKEIFRAAFQRVRKEQHIQPSWFNLFFSEGTFNYEKRKGFSITDVVDCMLKKDELIFSSFFYARQIFSLNEYYRTATDGEIERFTKHDKLLVEDLDGFKQCANTAIRRKIAMINDSNVLDDYSAKHIRNIARQLQVEIDIRDGKLVLPNNREKLKNILGFLDEEVYRGAFSSNTYLANSKRKIQS